MNPGAWQAGLNALVNEVPFADYLAELWGSEHVWYLAEELFAKGGNHGGKLANSPWHQDSSYVPIHGQHWVNMWISFEPLPARNSIAVVRGSHRGKRYNGTSYSDPDNPTKPLHRLGSAHPARHRSRSRPRSGVLGRGVVGHRARRCHRAPPLRLARPCAGGHGHTATQHARAAFLRRRRHLPVTAHGEPARGRPDRWRPISFQPGPSAALTRRATAVEQARLSGDPGLRGRSWTG